MGQQFGLKIGDSGRNSREKCDNISFRYPSVVEYARKLFGATAFSVVFGYCLWEPAESLDRRRFRPPGGAETYIRVRFFGADSFSGAFLCVF